MLTVWVIKYSMTGGCPLTASTFLLAFFSQTEWRIKNLYLSQIIFIFHSVDILGKLFQYGRQNGNLLIFLLQFLCFFFLLSRPQSLCWVSWRGALYYVEIYVTILRIKVTRNKYVHQILRNPHKKFISPSMTSGRSGQTAKNCKL